MVLSFVSLGVRLRGQVRTVPDFSISAQSVCCSSLWNPGGAAEGQMLNVSTNVSKTTCLHNVEFPSRGRSGFPCGVGVPEAGGSKCVCVCVLLHDLLQYPAVVC